MTAKGAFKILYSFDGTDGSSPFVLTAGSDGNLYGTTLGGGTEDAGTIFNITPDGNLTTVHSFAQHFYYYFGGLTQGTNGKFYGLPISGARRMTARSTAYRWV